MVSDVAIGGDLGQHPAAHAMAELGKASTLTDRDAGAVRRAAP
jgi:hypothetical protein